MDFHKSIIIWSLEWLRVVQRPDDDRLVKVHHRRLMQNYDTAPANLVTTRNHSRDQMMIDLWKSITENDAELWHCSSEPSDNT